MADNSQLLALAAQLDRDADELRGLTRSIEQATGPNVLAGGRLTESVDELIGLTERELLLVSADLEAVAAQLRAVEVVDIDLVVG